MRQLIIARKDLNMNPGKLAAQVAHASIAFMSRQIQSFKVYMPREDEYKEWFCGVFTKTICEAKNKNQLLKAVAIAEELGLKENVDFFLIKDACLTDLEPEEFDENGKGYTLTCIGFRPLDDDTAWKISKKYQLYR